jgi:hypothetical protein
VPATRKTRRRSSSYVEESPQEPEKNPLTMLQGRRFFVRPRQTRYDAEA